MLDHLPVEIIGEVLKHLDVDDIDTLFCVPRFREFLADRILFLYNEDLTSYADTRFDCENIPFQYYTDESSLSKILTQATLNKVFSIIVFTDMSRDSELTNSMIRSTCGDVPTQFCFSSLAAPSDMMGRADFDFANTQLYPMCTFSVHSFYETIADFEEYFKVFKFPNLLRLTLVNVSFMPESLDYPKLEDLTLELCESTNVESRWNLPSLKTLTVSQSFNTINDSIDYQATTIEELTLHDIDDIETWKGISNSSILYLIIQSCSSWKMENVLLNSLKDLKVTGSSGTFKLSKVSMPQVERIHIVSSLFHKTMVYLSSFDVPNLHELTLDAYELTCFKDINAPSVAFADLNIHPESDNTTGLIEVIKDVKKLRSSNGLWWKYTPMLESLILPLCYEEDFDEFNKQRFPSLKKFYSTVTYDDDGSTSLLPNSPVLEVYQVYNPPDLDRLDRLQVYQKTLKVIDITEEQVYRGFRPKSVLLVNVQFPLLTDLILRLRYSPNIELRGCHFPNLKVLVLENESKTLDETTCDSTTCDISTIDIQAPKLEKLYVKRLKLGDVFQVSRYPELTQCAITKCPGLERVIVLECPTLINVQIYPHKSQSKIQVDHDGSLDEVEVEPLSHLQLTRIQ